MTEDVDIKIKSSFDKAGIIAAGTALGNFAADAVRQIARVSFESLKLGAEFLEMAETFRGSAKDLELFRKATSGTVTDGSLIKLSQYASDLGVALSDQALLFSLAEDAADKYGGGVESNFERVINASDGTAKGLRAVGISTNAFNDEVDKLTKTMGVKLDQMEADEAQNIRLQAIYNLTGVSIDSINKKTQSTADTMASVGVQYENLKTLIGVGLTSSLAKVTGQLDFSNALDANIKQWQYWGEQIGTIINSLQGFDILGNIGDIFSGNTPRVSKLFDLGGELMYNESLYNATKNIIPQSNTPYGPELPPGFNTPKSNIGGKGGNMDKASENKLQKATAYVAPGGGVFLFDTSGVDVQSKILGQMSGEDIKQMGYQIESDYIAGIQPAESRDTLADIQQGYSLIGQSMDLLNVGTDTFVGKLMAAFNFANSALTVGSQIFSFIRTVIGVGGMPSGGGAGAVNQSYNMQRQSPVNLYLSSNVNSKYFKAQIENYNATKNYIKIS